MSNLMMSGGGKFVTRNEIALIDTPEATHTWRPVPHIDVVDAVEQTLQKNNLNIVEEQFGLARQGQQLFGVLKVNSSSNPDWIRCVGVRNSHDKCFSLGLSAGISVLVCSNLCFGGTAVIKRKHTSRIDLQMLVEIAASKLYNQFDILERSCNRLRTLEISMDDARIAIVRSAELGVINSSDILPVFREFQNPSHEEFADPTRWSLMNAITETVKKYTPARVDYTYQQLNKAFGLDGTPSLIWPDQAIDSGVEDLVSID